MVSLKDISEACGVSVATVSKALNDHRDVGQKTKERIRETAKEMGYYPNSAAKALKTNRTHNLGILFADRDLSGLTHDYFAHVLDSFKTTAEEKGYDITFINCNKTGTNNMSFLEHAKYRNFDGVMIACTDFTSPEVQELVLSDIPVVTVDYVFNNCMAICSDNAEGMKELVRYIYQKGHRKIAYITGDESSVTQARVSAFYQTAEQLGLEIPDEYIREGLYRATEICETVTKELMNLPDPPTCIIYPDDFASIGGMNALQELGLEIGKDVSIAGYDGIRLSKYLAPQLTTIWQDTKTIGRLAAEELINVIERPKSTLIRMIGVEGKLVEGQSVGQINAGD